LVLGEYGDFLCKLLLLVLLDDDDDDDDKYRG
jgi:hypothetical protein